MKKIFAFGAVTALTAVAPGLRAAEAEVKANVDLPERSETRVEIEKDKDIEIRANAEASASQDKVHSSNKASGLIGMEVRNSQNEKLGEIKDLVLDVGSGKISYAVLAVGGFLGIGEKLIAVPPSAFKPSDDHSHLMLNADKSRIQAAPGFAATAWPSLKDPEFGKFWSSEATGGPASSETRRETDIDIDRERTRLKGEVDLDSSKDRIYTDADERGKVNVKVEKD